MRKGSAAQIGIGLVALLLGTIVYLVDRPPGQISVYAGVSLFQTTPTVFGAIGKSLPTFVHVFAFILLTSGLLTCGKKLCLAVCLGWFFVDSAFELGQHPQVAAWLLKSIPPWFEKVPILESIDSYFVHGTFDPRDMFSIALGALAAYVVIQRAQLGGADEE